MKGDEQKWHIKMVLRGLERQNRIPSVETEYRFHPIRRWRFDWAIPELKIAIEYEGIISRKSRHTTIGGFTKDCDKYNAAAALGWKVLRYTALNFGNLMKDLNKIL